MDEKKQRADLSPPQAETSYSTGSTNPPKSHTGLIAFLLAAVIILGGISSATSLLNIRLFRQLAQQSGGDPVPIHFSATPEFSQNPNTQQPAVSTPSLGLTGIILSERDRFIAKLPQGFYITRVTKNSDAAAKGISPGDILLRFDNIRITDIDSLKAQLYTHKPGDCINVVIYRGGSQYSLTLTVGETN